MENWIVFLPKEFIHRYLFYRKDFIHRLPILQEIDEPALIPHIAEASSKKYPYEVLFRSLHKLLMDTATSEYYIFFSLIFFMEYKVILSFNWMFLMFLFFPSFRYLFCDDFFGEESIFNDIFAGTLFIHYSMGMNILGLHYSSSLMTSNLII